MVPDAAYQLPLNVAEIFTLLRVPVIVLAIVATVLGVIGCLRPGQPRLAAATAAALGIAALLPMLAGGVGGVLVNSLF
ncbi:hypothetical protein C5E10_06710 [Pseudoclavibacter sp. RFBG4]|uniref:hypothetical protein n=1 Tax=Pseudoclavibacter sp. RFBG4 TaxID=2080575 RepID=UPI000CE8CE41|nr:hypothetical protein [Pseudoclavibacter sp. RFBG4]PPG34378.1 hypothetical protein C5E10_06710 [Pseudoclavibacter sp. RFBG4]